MTSSSDKFYRTLEDKVTLPRASNHQSKNLFALNIPTITRNVFF